jgi:hypothetical protein
VKRSCIKRRPTSDGLLEKRQHTIVEVTGCSKACHNFDILQKHEEKVVGVLRHKVAGGRVAQGRIVGVGRAVQHRVGGKVVQHRVGKVVQYRVGGKVVQHRVEGKVVQHRVEGKVVQHRVGGKVVQDKVVEVPQGRAADHRVAQHRVVERTVVEVLRRRFAPDVEVPQSRV